MIHNFAIVSHHPLTVLFTSGAYRWQIVSTMMTLYQNMDLLKLQKHATNMVPKLRELSYTERLKELGLPTLQSRRERGDMITV